ncbi:MAG: hypothetical protein DRQ48_11215 [Gammaproteobacteria bacterium]|nr:MAG: hypothetical protein DRQ48_11215 [Gammaproteobacteria bacterium]
MKIADCLPFMTQMFLSRTVDGILKVDVPRGDEERLREQIRQNEKELADPSRVKEALGVETLDRAQRILMEGVLTSLLLAPDMSSGEDGLYERVRGFEQSVVKEGTAEDAFAFSDPHSIDIYSEILAVALEDDAISLDEFRLLERLRTKLGVSRHEHRLLAARLGKFPKPGNELHSLAEFREALKQLQTMGVVLYCNRAEGGARVVLPEEIAPAVKSVLGFELSPEAQMIFLDNLTTGQLRHTLQANGLPLSGSKSDRSERLVKACVKPSEILNVLKNEELGDLCRKLPGVSVSGSKPDRVSRIISHFDSLVTKEPEVSDDPRAIFYQYFEEFAARDNQNLYQRKLIRHDRDMESGFEEGTRYLFEEKLGLELIEMPGSEHADGGVRFPNEELLLWDNKGKEDVYTFPKSHFDQFKRYIRESAVRVNVFLVVVPSYESSTRIQAMKLKHDSGTDTDIAVISAEDLKWLAENWPKHAPTGKFSLEIFNMTGLLTRATLEERVSVLLK